MPARYYAVLLAIQALAVPPGAAAQGGQPQPDPRLRSALELLRTGNEWTLQQQVSICEIPAPPFAEQARAAEYRRRFEALGLRNVRIDAEGNVIGERPGSGRGPRVVLSAHLDTVFPDSIDVSVRREGARLHGPGIGDDCRGLAVLLAVARALRDASVRTSGTIVFIGTVGEEGEGNLRGVRHLVDRQTAGPIDYFISVDGAGLSVTTRAVGSHRYRVVIHGPGGHSYTDFGLPNPIHALGRAIAAIAAIPVPQTPRTTLNVGVIEGGTSVNSIPTGASLVVDLRSESQEALDTLDRRFRRAVTQGVDAELVRWPSARARLRTEIIEIGKRPAGATADTSRIVQASLAAARILGFIPALTAGSTDANHPMSRGIPAIAIDGGGTGGGAHTPAEWYDDGDDGWKGPQWALLLTAALVGLD